MLPQNFWRINGVERGLGYASRMFVCFCFNFACALAVLGFIFCAALTLSSAFDLIRPPVFTRSQAPEAVKIGSAGSSERALSVPLFRGLGRWFSAKFRCFPLLSSSTPLVFSLRSDLAEDIRLFPNCSKSLKNFLSHFSSNVFYHKLFCQ